MKYFICANGKEIGPIKTKAAARAEMDSTFESLATDGQVTLQMTDGEGTLLAVRTNRKIMATCFKQRWVGAANARLEPVGEPVQFDVTRDILSFGFSNLADISDRSQWSDWLMDGNVDHDGPFEIEVVQSICEFFGVEDVSQITEAAFNSVAKGVKKPKLEMKMLKVTVTVFVQVKEGVDLQEVADEMDYNFQSTVAGACVTDTEFAEAQWV